MAANTSIMDQPNVGSPKPTTIDEYLQHLDANQREALQRIREIVHSVAPEAEECLSYGQPAFRLGKLLVAFGATANHCAFYPMSGTTIAVFERQLSFFDTSKGAIRFAPERPLPASLIRKLVKARMKENKTQLKWGSSR